MYLLFLVVIWTYPVFQTCHFLLLSPIMYWCARTPVLPSCSYYQSTVLAIIGSQGDGHDRPLPYTIGPIGPDNWWCLKPLFPGNKYQVQCSKAGIKPVLSSEMRG